MKKYTWLNISNGEFSNSWIDESLLKVFTEEEIKEAARDGWKLIEFKCLNDDKFEFTNHMKLK